MKKLLQLLKWVFSCGYDDIEPVPASEIPAKKYARQVNVVTTLCPFEAVPSKTLHAQRKFLRNLIQEAPAYHGDIFLAQKMRKGSDAVAEHHVEFLYAIEAGKLEYFTAQLGGLTNDPNEINDDSRLFDLVFMKYTLADDVVVEAGLLKRARIHSWAMAGNYGAPGFATIKVVIVGNYTSEEIHLQKAQKYRMRSFRDIRESTTN